MEDALNSVLYEVQVDVFLREGIADPEGSTIQHAAEALGFLRVSSLAAGRSFKVRLEALSSDDARDQVLSLAGRLLANPVLQEFEVSHVRVVA
jgi:phosphoribosylformylglycinamidine synthase